MSIALPFSQAMAITCTVAICPFPGSPADVVQSTGSYPAVTLGWNTKVETLWGNATVSGNTTTYVPFNPVWQPQTPSSSAAGGNYTSPATSFAGQPSGTKITCVATHFEVFPPSGASAVVGTATASAYTIP